MSPFPIFCGLSGQHSFPAAANLPPPFRTRQTTDPRPLHPHKRRPPGISWAVGNFHYYTTQARHSTGSFNPVCTLQTNGMVQPTLPVRKRWKQTQSSSLNAFSPSFPPFLAQYSDADLAVALPCPSATKINQNPITVLKFTMWKSTKVSDELRTSQNYRLRTAITFLKSRDSIKDIFGTAVLDPEKFIWENVFSRKLEEVY